MGARVEEGGGESTGVDAIKKRTKGGGEGAGFAQHQSDG